MTARSLAETLLKVWGVLYLTRCLVSLPAIFAQFGRSGASNADESFKYVVGVNLVQVLLLGVVGLTMVALASAIARWLVRANEESPEALTGPVVTRIAFGALGAYLIIVGLADLASALMKIVGKPQYESTIPYLWRGSPSELASAVVRSVGGALLLLGREGTARVYRKARGMSGPNESSAV